MKNRSLFLCLLAAALMLSACGTQTNPPVSAAVETVAQTIPETVAQTIPETVAQTIPETVAETVPETEAPVADEVVEEIEITTENWQDYFERRDVQKVYVNNTGEITLREFGYGVFLKDEYIPRLAQNNPVDVSIEMQVDAVRYQVYGDLTTNNFIIRDDATHNIGTEILTAQVEDYRGNDQIEVDSDFYNAVGAFFTIDGEFGA